MTPAEQELSDGCFNGQPVCELSAQWTPPFQPWANDASPLAFWAWQRPDTFTPVYDKEALHGEEEGR